MRKIKANVRKQIYFVWNANWPEDRARRRPGAFDPGRAPSQRRTRRRAAAPARSRTTRSRRRPRQPWTCRVVRWGTWSGWPTRRRTRSAQRIPSLHGSSNSNNSEACTNKQFEDLTCNDLRDYRRRRGRHANRRDRGRAWRRLAVQVGVGPRRRTPLLACCYPGPPEHRSTSKKSMATCLVASDRSIGWCIYSRRPHCCLQRVFLVKTKAVGTKHL